MLIVRPLSALGGLIALIALSRTLNSADYGAYFAFWAVVEILILLSNLGLLHTAYRYVSATEWANGQITINGPALQLLVLRVGSLIAFAALLFAFPDVFHTFIAMDGGTRAMIPAIAIVTLCEGLARYLEVLFDSMLFQKSSQITQLSRTLIRLFGFAFLLTSSSLNLHTVLVVEILAASLGMCLALLIFLRLQRQSVSPLEPQEAEMLNSSRVLNFAIPAYVTQALGISYGPDSLKLALGSVAGAASVAVFGFAYSLAAVIQRYMPANIFAGIMRPVFVAASQKPDPQKVLSELFSVSIKLNWVFILPVFCFFFFGASKLLSHMSAGNYPEAGVVATFIIFGFLAIAIHLSLSMYCLARETSWPPLLATAASTLGLPIGFFLGRQYGAVGIAIAFGLSEIIWSFTCLILLRLASAPLRVDWLGLLKMLFIAGLTVLVCMPLVSKWPNLWLLPSLLAPSIFLLALYPARVFSRQESAWLISVLPLQKLHFVKK